MKSYLQTQVVQTPDEIRHNFDLQGKTYSEQHGDADRLLTYRLGLFEQMANFSKEDTVLDIGCGNGHHLHGLSHLFAKGIGIDFSEQMIFAAQRRNKGLNLHFQQDDATKLASIQDDSIDVVICSGALEHMVDQSAVFKHVFRILKKDGKIAMLTLNGSYVWYKNIAPLLGFKTRHYSSDRFLSKSELQELMAQAGFEAIRIQPWTFIPRGDMPNWVASILSVFDHIGKWVRISIFRGGLQLYGEKG